MKFTLAFVATLIMAAICSGQSIEIPKNELTFWGGYSPDSATIARVFGRLPNARFGIAAVRYSRRFNNSKVFNLKYTADLTPMAIVQAPERVGRRTTAYGFGGSPIGLQTNFRPRKRVQPFIALSGGFLYLNRKVPADLGARLQFTFDVGVGTEFRVSRTRAVTFGYKYFHISNGNRGIDNPGIDNNLFYVGYTFFGK